MPNVTVRGAPLTEL